LISETSEVRNPEDSANDRLPIRRPRAPGALRLFQVYEQEQAQRAKEKGGIIAPQKVLHKWIKTLVKSIKKDNGIKSTSKDALDLFEATSIATETGPINCWDEHLAAQIVDIFETHSAFKSDISQSISVVIDRLKNTKQETENTMNNNNNNTQPLSLGALASGLASSVSPADGTDSSTGISNILQDIGPACTQNPTTFRETLAEITANNTVPGLNEAALARVIHFFCDKRTDSEGSSSVISASSSLLGSLIPGRGNEICTDGWNLKSVATILEQDYSSRDWDLVAQCWDFPNFFVKDIEQFRTLLDLYISGAKRPPPLPAFTSQWRNSAGQLCAIEFIMTIPQKNFTTPLNEEESADAATASPGTTGINPQSFASMEILQRLLFLSDIPSLYRRVRDLFVKGLLGCPEVLLCSLVRLQLHVANTPRQSGREALANAGLQIKTELMRELIPLFFRPNTHHRVQNAPAALRRLYAISPNTVTAACFEAWRSTVGDNSQIRVATLVHIINIARLLPSPADAVASLLNGGKDPEFSVAIAFVMADNEFLQLKPWLNEKLSQRNTVGIFSAAIVSYIAKTHSTASLRGSEPTPLVSLENIAIALQILQALDTSALSQPFSNTDGTQMQGTTLGDNIKAVADACITAHPNLRGSLSVSNNANKNNNNSGGGAVGPAGTAGAADDVEEMATAYFQKIYTSEQSIGEVVEMLKRFKTSGNSKENEIFACMVHNLFDEYRFFSKYPEKELRITGILFGTLIEEQLVSSITLGIALRYVLEALRKPPSPPGSTTSSGKMFNFGMFALEQFKGRLHEWPQYCSHIVQIPHLKEGYGSLVAEIETAMRDRTIAANTQNPPIATAQNSNGNISSVVSIPEEKNPNPTGFVSNTKEASSAQSMEFVRASSNSSNSSLCDISEPIIPIDEKPRIAEFGPMLGRAVTDLADEEQEHEAPPENLLDRIQFLINNLAPSNVESKSQELKDLLEPKYFSWLAHFLVVKRISTQANYHSLYLSFLDNLGGYGKGLLEAILDSAYRNIGKLLRSPKITTSSSERSYLKNLGIWLGHITLARNRPILQVMLDCKELLLQGYETGKLIAVAPFLAKILEGAKNSFVFRPPNPWLMGLLGVFRSVYHVDGLKMNIKFEVEVLCKNLGTKLEDISLKDEELAKRIAPVKEKNPDFNIKDSSKTSVSNQGPDLTSDAKIALNIPLQTDSTRALTSSGVDDEGTVIPNLAAYVTVNQSLNELLQQSPQQGALASLNVTSLKRAVPIAVDRAIREIIQPVVERSVTIACITTKEIITKDFAMESDDSKMRKAGQLMVANLAGSLALVTCREPLRSSVSTHLRQLLTPNTSDSDSKLTEQEQNVIEQCVQICATDNLELGCMLIEKAATEKAVRDVDEALSQQLNSRRKHREQTGQPFYDMSIFGNNQRYPAGLPDQLRPKPGGLRSEHFELYDSFQRLPRQTPTPGGVINPSVASTGLSPGRSGPTRSNENEIQVNAQKPQLGIEALSTLATKLDTAVTTLLASAGPRAPEVKLQMLPHDHQIRQLLSAVNQILPNLNTSGELTRSLAQSEQDSVLQFSQGIFKRLYELSLAEPLRLEALVALLEKINVSCPKLGTDMGTWATYAPTNTEAQRRLHRTVLLLLVRSHLLAVNELDQFLAARADNGRNPVWVEFALLFIRTAFMERISLPNDFPKVIDLMTRIADGRSLAGQNVIQTYKKPILRMLEEMRGLGQTSSQNATASAQVSNGAIATTTNDQWQTSVTIQDRSSLSVDSLSRFSTASVKVAEATEGFAQKDPPNARQQVTQLLENWIRVNNEASGNEQINAQFLQYLQQFGVGTVEEHTERFVRLACQIVVDAVLKSATSEENGRTVLNYAVADVYCKLLLLMFKNLNSGSSPEQIKVQRLAMLNKILGCTVRTMMWDVEKSKASSARGKQWDQRPWYRIFMNLVIDINKPDPELESIRLGILSVFAATFHVSQPLVVPSFSFSWFELVSHRHFLPNLLLIDGQQGWDTIHQLMIDYLLFLEPYIKVGEMVSSVKKLYEGTLRVFLVLLHDFPSFLAGYHLSFCNVIPQNCVQLRNMVLSATPKGMNPPDPFTPNLKIDLLTEITQGPVILSNVLGPIESFRSHLDAFLKDGQTRDFIDAFPMLLKKELSNEIDAPKVNSLVLYVGVHALARQSSQMTLSHTPEMEVLQKLMDFDDKGRYICLNSIANQLRYPSSHTHYFSCVMLYLFSESKNVAVKEQITRVLLERLILHRPHPWGLLVTFIELIKNQERYGFWNYPFTRCATEIEKVFESVARSVMPPGSPLLAGGREE
jgi:CCR4-NOT transcription complex subunit 1